MTQKYSFSFTGASLREKEMAQFARVYLKGENIDYVQEFGFGKTSTGKRMLSEYKKRIKTLTQAQLELLAEGGLPTQKKMAFLAVCKTYDLIRDFVIEVLRDKLLMFDPYLTEGDYISFIRRKVDLHPELEEITDLTHKKIKQVTFLVLEQAGVIDNIKSKIIQPQFLENTVLDSMINDNPEWLKIYLMSDADIKNSVENT